MVVGVDELFTLMLESEDSSPVDPTPLGCVSLDMLLVKVSRRELLRLLPLFAGEKKIFLRKDRCQNWHHGIFTQKYTYSKISSQPNMSAWDSRLITNPIMKGICK